MSVSALIIGKGDSKGRVPIHCDDNGNLYLVGAVPSPGGAVPTNAVSNAPAASKVVSPAPAVLFSLQVANPTASDVFILLFDAVAAPADTAVPVDYAVIPAGWVGGFSYGESGREFSTGIVAVASSTLATLTTAGASYLFSARYKA